MLLQSADLALARQKSNKYMPQIFVTVLCLLFFAIPVNGQDHDEKEIDMNKLIKLFPSKSKPCNSDDLEEFCSCKAYKLFAKKKPPTEPPLFYYAEKMLREYQGKIKVQLVNAKTLKYIQLTRHNSRTRRTSKSWWSDVKKESEKQFRVFELWKKRPKKTASLVFRLKWEVKETVNGVENVITYYSEPFELQKQK